MGRPKKPDSEKAVRVTLYLSPRAARLLSAQAGEVHARERSSGAPTLPGFCSRLLERVADRLDPCF